MRSSTFTVVTYNIHKGWGAWMRAPTLVAMREALQKVDADLLLLQEVVGEWRRQVHHPQWSSLPQHEFLAAGHWPYQAYVGNRFRRHSHHGNAVLSRWPIDAVCNHDLSASRRWESRGALQVTVVLPGTPRRRLQVFCVHLGLLRRWRRWQLARLQQIVAAVPADEPVIVGGDFNDWRGDACRDWAPELGLTEVRQAVAMQRRRTYPARGWRFGAIDRLYVRGLKVLEAQVLAGTPWSRLSDHLPLWARLTLEPASRQ